MSSKRIITLIINIWDGTVLDKEHHQRNGTEPGWNVWKKNKQGRNHLAEGPCERNDFKKVGMCPPLSPFLNL